MDFYGILQEIVEVEYIGEPKKLVLFYCKWYNPNPKDGTRVHEQYRIVEVNARKRYRIDVGDQIDEE